MNDLDQLWQHLRAAGSLLSPFVSGLIAAAVVHLLTQSRERERWILDCKKQEFRELLSALSESFHAMLTAKQRYSTLIVEEQQTFESVATNSVRMMLDRIYIVDDLPLPEMSSRWVKALQLFESDRDVAAFHREFSGLSDLIVTAANLSVPKSSFQRLKFWR